MRWLLYALAVVSIRSLLVAVCTIPLLAVGSAFLAKYILSEATCGKILSSFPGLRSDAMRNQSLADRMEQPCK